MVAVRRRILNTATKMFDLVLMIVAFGVATLPRLATGGPVSFAQFLELRIKLQNFVVFFVLLWLWHFIFTMVGLYGSKRLASRRAEAVDVIKATSLGALVLMLASFLLHFRMVTPGFVAIFWTFSTFFYSSCADVMLRFAQ